MEPRSATVWGKQGVNSSRSSHTIGIMGQSREGDWVPGHVSKPDCTDHRLAGNSDRAHILKSTPNLADEDTVTQTAKKWTEDPRRTNVWGKRGVWRIGQYKTQQLKRKSRAVGDIIDWVEVYPQVMSDGRNHEKDETAEEHGTEDPYQTKENDKQTEYHRNFMFGKQPADESLKRKCFSTNGRFRM